MKTYTIKTGCSRDKFNISRHFFFKSKNQICSWCLLFIVSFCIGYIWLSPGFNAKMRKENKETCILCSYILSFKIVWYDSKIQYNVYHPVYAAIVAMGLFIYCSWLFETETRISQTVKRTLVTLHVKDSNSRFTTVPLKPDKSCGK